MAKKAIHHFNRGIVIGFEIFGVLATLLFLAWGGLLFRLSQGPLPVDFLVDRIEKSFSGYQTGLTFDVGTAQLVWGGKFEPFEIEIKDLQILRADRTPVLVVSRVGVQLSKRAIIFGRIVPKVVRVYSPAFRLVRWEDGHFSLNLGEAPVTQMPEAEVSATDHEQIIKNLLEQMKEHDLFNLVGGLREIRIDNAAMFYEDRVLGTGWRARKADIIIARKSRGIAADSIVEVDMGAEKSTIVRISMGHVWQEKKTNVIVYFSSIVPALFSGQTDFLKDLSDIHLPLKGNVAFQLDADFRPGVVRFLVGSDPGTFNARGLYPKPLPVTGLYVSGMLDTKTGVGVIEQANINLGGPRLEAKASIAPPDIEGYRRLSFSGNLFEMPIDDLDQYWPGSLAPDPREWVTQNLSKGQATKATIKSVMRYSENAERKVILDELSGEIDFQGITVDYFPPLLAVTGAAGRAFYDEKSFNLDISGGVLGDMTVSKSTIRITDLEKAVSADEHPDISIDVSLSGPLRTALTILDSKPLEYPKNLGINLAGVDGHSKVDVTFKFPLYKLVELEDVQVSAEAQVENAALQDIVGDRDLSAVKADVILTDGRLGVRGSGKLGTMPVSFDWQKFFSQSAPEAERMTAQLTIDGPSLQSFGIPPKMNPQGSTKADVDFTRSQNGNARLGLKADLREMSFLVPFINIEKPFGASGVADISMTIDKGVVRKMNSVSLKTDKLDISGSLGFDSQGKFSEAVFQRLRFDSNDISLTAKAGAQDGFDVQMRGSFFDGSSYFSEENTTPSDVEAAKTVTPFRLKMEMDRLQTGENKDLKKVKLFAVRSKHQRIEQLEMDAEVGGKPLYLRYMPGADGQGKSLRFEADNAGAALHALGITSAITGGKLVVDGQPYLQSGPRDLAGSVILTDFTARKVPALAKLLNAMSLVGVMDLLNNKGIGFKKARARFFWIDRGAPLQTENTRMIKITDGQTSGASLGLTFEGNIDNWRSIYDLNGTIIPVSDVNKIISAIPIVGNVLTAGGEGIIAATYKIKGPTQDPSVTVNPLAALAPGILRKIFFDN